MLKREISRLNVLVASAGAMVGSGWLFSPFISAQIAGSNALVSWVLAAIISQEEKKVLDIHGQKRTPAILYLKGFLPAI